MAWFSRHWFSPHWFDTDAVAIDPRSILVVIAGSLLQIASGEDVALEFTDLGADCRFEIYRSPNVTGVPFFTTDLDNDASTFLGTSETNLYATLYTYKISRHSSLLTQGLLRIHDGR